MNGMGGVAALVAALSGACLLLMWKYTGWSRRVRTVATALLCVAVAVVLVPALVGEPKSELSVVRVSGLEVVPASAETPVEPEQTVAAAPPLEPPPAAAQPPEEAPPPETTADAEAPPPETTDTPPAPPAPPQANAAGTQTPAYYVLNTSSKKFHLPTCADAGRIKAENRATIATRQGAVDGGYAPCKNCKP